MTDTTEFAHTLDALDARITGLEARLDTGNALPLAETLAEGQAIVAALLSAYAHDHGRVVPVTNDLLEVFKAFVKGDASLNAVRDNVRELVYYQNCIAAGRLDALPKAPERMVVHTARHIYLYLRSRCEQEGRLS